MKRVKTIIALVLVIATTLSANIYAVEDDNSNVIQQTEITEALLEELALLKSELQMYDIFSPRYEEIQSEMETVNELLEENGVHRLAEEEVMELPSMQENMARIGYPGSTSTIDWYSSTISYTVGGHAYYVQRVYAQGKGSVNSTLRKSEIIPYNPNKINDASNSAIIIKILTTAADLGGSFIPSTLVSFTWSQMNSLLGNILTPRTIYSCAVRINLVSTLCFSYVSYTQSSQQYFCLATSGVNGSATIMVTDETLDEDGIYQYNISKKTAEHNSNSGLAKAISNYNNSSGITVSYSYTANVKLYEYNSSCLRTISLASPSYMSALY